ncbi:MAG: hypothetical protein Q8911_06305 [Bacillota bacterium]|nr:hypothetical protein [Bacillota bacterium]
MDHDQFEQLGDKLREVGHLRRELAEKVFEQVRLCDDRASRNLLMQLSQVSDEAITIISKQKEILDNKVKNLANY